MWASGRSLCLLQGPITSQEILDYSRALFFRRACVRGNRDLGTRFSGLHFIPADLRGLSFISTKEGLEWEGVGGGLTQVQLAVCPEGWSFYCMYYAMTVWVCNCWIIFVKSLPCTFAGPPLPPPPPPHPPPHHSVSVSHNPCQIWSPLFTQYLARQENFTSFLN